MASVGHNGGGDLFAGIKFCFLQRLPQRQRWIELVKLNGGEVVQLEKRADYVVADQIKRNACPPGSISWKFIEQSVRKGALEDTEDYRAGPVTHAVREVGSGQPKRMGRTPYTAEDDRILMDWVTETERSGGPTRGNVTYRQLAVKYPRHTWQSWRDRWVKHLSTLPCPEEPEDDDDDDHDEEMPPPKANTRLARSAPKSPSQASEGRIQPLLDTKAIPSRVKEREPQVKSNGKIMRSLSPPDPWIAKSDRGMEFTGAEIRLLIKNYDDIQNLDPDKSFDAWAAWSATYPDHTPQEWRNYFVKELTPVIEKQRARASKEAAGVAERDLSMSGKSKLRLSGARELRPARRSPDIGVIDPPLRVNKEVDHPTKEESLFEEELRDLAKALELQVEFHPKICGRTLPLFRLWQVVMSDEFGGKSRVDGRKLWPTVARKLNFSDFQHLGASKELKACYEEILADFEETKQQYLEDLTPTASDEESLIEAQLFKFESHEETEPEEVEEEFDRDVLSSPRLPHSSGKRRKLNYSEKGSLTKRQRVDKGKGKELEILSTPEDVINNQPKTSSYQSSPLKGSPILRDYMEQGRQDNFLKGQFKRPDLKSITRGVEPETQDFNFPPDNSSEDDGSGSPPMLSPSIKANRQNHTRDPTPWKALDEDLSVQSQTESELNAQLNAYFDGCVALGYTPEVVFVALKACSLETRDAMQVMEALSSGGRIPKDMPGVWTSKDDLALEDEDEDSPEFLRIVAKHGDGYIAKRRRFLEDEDKVRGQ